MINGWIPQPLWSATWPNWNMAYQQHGIMVWGAISANSRSLLVCITGTLMAHHYVDELLQPVALLYLKVIPNGVLQQDNAQPHTSRTSLNASIASMVPHLLPIEHLWDTIGCWLSTLPLLQNEDELWTLISTAWSTIPENSIWTLIASVSHQIQCYIAQHGGHTPY